MPSLPTPATTSDSPDQPARHWTGLITIVFTDLVGSTALKQQVGDRTGASLIQQHHGLVRELLRAFKGGEEIETAGDSFLIVFTRPSDAVHFGLLLQARLRGMSQGTAARLVDRIGIHVGEVVIRGQEGSANAKGLTGIQVDTCARVMDLAKGGQILLTRSAFDNARQMLKGEDVAGVGPLAWLNHGSYLLKGIEAALEVCEVGEVGMAPLQAPAGSEKAQRQVTAEGEAVLGWRPAVGEFVPNTRWGLETKLGEGGFGEVWLGRHQHTKERGVFKFCFQAERVRFLKREMTLFRLLKERVGEHPNVVRLHDVMLDQPPYYVEMDYVEGADLASWIAEHGGVEEIPLATRLEIVAQAADGLQAAHEAGIIHRDIKPANILIGGKGIGPSEVRVKLTDFGIGQVVSEEYLKGITRAGFTQTILSDSASSRTGTQIYMAPELLAGKPASTRSDIYSLGVVLYQLLVGDFSRPVTIDWADEISDSLLRDDLKHCFAGSPQGRFVGTGQLAKSLRTLPERRAALERQEAGVERQQAEKAALERAAYRRGIVRTATVAVLIVAAIVLMALYAFKQAARATLAQQSEKQQRLQADAEKTEASHLLYVANVNLAQQAWDQTNIGRLRQLLEDTQGSPYRGFEWYFWQRQTHQGVKTLRGHLGAVTSVAFSPDGQRIITGSEDKTAKVWDALNARELLTLKGHSDRIRSVAFSPDGKRIVTGSDDKTAKVWDAANGRELLTLKGHTSWVMSVAVSPDSQRIVTASKDGTAKVWDAARGREKLTLKWHGGEVPSAAFSPDGRRIVTGSADGMAKVWDAVSGHETLALKWHGGEVSSAAFSPDGQQIVTGSQDKTAKVWDAASGLEVLTLKGHGAAVSSVAFSPDGQRIVTGSDDQTARVWEAASGREVLTLKGHSGAVSAVAFSRDGQRIVTGSTDQTAKVWEAATAKEVANWQVEDRAVEQQERAAEQQRVAAQRERTAQEERQMVVRARDSIKQWLILAPIPLATGQSGTEGLDTEQIEGEAQLRPRAGESRAIGGGESKWRAVALTNEVIDFNAIVGQWTEHCVAYAVCYLRSETEQHGIKMLAGSEDEAKVYLNGTQVYKCPLPRAFFPDQATVPDITLNAGLNVLVFKVVNETADWQGSIRFTDSQGNPVMGIKVTLNPEAKD
jgi:class 3 adenylate cyclase/dipeptidyl aminopeptidase/acylaminoacyl peptidase/tRNA A-37 threonylcarbamoyl transferase component Bud32